MYVPKYRSYSEVKKNRNVVDIWNKFQQVVSLFLICYKTLYGTFLVSEGIFREMQVIRYFLCIRDIGENSLNRLSDC